MKQFTLFSVLVLSFITAACTSTHFLSTWKDPETAFKKLEGQKIAAFLISADESTRRSVETIMAEELTARGGEGIAGFEVLNVEQAKSAEKAAAALKEKGVEAVITMRVVSEDKVTRSSPSQWHHAPVYRKWGGYWYKSWVAVYEPGEVRTDRVVRVETLIYTLEAEKLIWASQSKTTNPNNIQSLVRELAGELDKEIAKSGLL